MDAIRLLTPPVSEPVTLEQARNFVRVDSDDDDALLRGLITAARQEAEAVTGRVLGDSAWAVAVPPLSGPFEVPLVPCTALTAVEAEGMAVAPGLYALAPASLRRNRRCAPSSRPAWTSRRGKPCSRCGRATRWTASPSPSANGCWYGSARSTSSGRASPWGRTSTNLGGHSWTACLIPMSSREVSDDQ